MSDMTAPFPDQVPCRICGHTAYDLSDALPFPPCPHDDALCGDCLLLPDGCQDCRLDAEAHMYRSGEYDAGADPFVRPERFAADDAHAEARPREVEPGIFRWPSTKDTP
jgi:hypothetical protein